MNEQILKRLQDTMRLFSTVLSQMEELQWVVKDVIEDLVLALNDEHSSIRDLKEGETSACDESMRETGKPPKPQSSEPPKMGGSEGVAPS